MESLDEEKREQLIKMYPIQKLEGLSAEQLLDLLPFPQNSHVIVAPLAEVVSIRIEIIDHPDVQHKISGTIQITDGEGNIFHFYNREDDNPETILSGGTLTLTIPEDHIIVPSNIVKVDVNLKDVDNNVEIIRGSFNWNCMKKAGHDEIKFKGKYGCAVLNYATFFHAVVARVDIMLLRRKGDDTKSSNVKIYGEIIAHHGSNLSSVLFDKKQVESVIQEYGSYITLSRHVLIVPASTSVEIYVKLFNGETHQQIIEGKMEFDGIRYPSLQDIIEGQSDILLVQFESSEPYMQPSMERVQRENRFLEEQSSSAMTINRNLHSPFGPKLFEFYSISIGGGNGEDVNLWGWVKVSVDDDHNHVFLFNRDKCSSHNVLPYETIPMMSYSNCLAMIAICIRMRLRDDKGRLISCGYMTLDDHHCETYKSLLNRQLCSIIRATGDPIARGTDGYYGVIHYSIFDAGVQAMVSIHLSKKIPTMKYVKIEGSICTRYSGFDYSIPYHKEYYRRRLFSTRSAEPWMHCPDSSVLSQSSVMVPEGSALIIDFELEVTAKEASDSVSQVGNCFKQPLEFKVSMGCLTAPKIMTKEIDLLTHRIMVHIEWKPVL